MALSLYRMMSPPTDSPVQSTPAATIMVGQHYRELDGLRGIAVLLVIWYHCRLLGIPMTALQGFYFAASDAAWIGVELFFVLSGFLITGMLLDTCGQPHYFSHFFQRRALRILPLYYLAVALTVLAARLFPQFDAVQQSSRVGNAAYWLHFSNFLPVFQIDPTPVLAHFWSLAVEMQFYLLWPVAVLWSWKSRSLARLCLFIWVVCILFRLAMAPFVDNGPQFLTPSRLDGLVLGAWIATMLKQRSSLVALRPLAARVALYSSIVILTLFVRMGQFGASGLVQLTMGLPAVAVFFAAVVVLVLTSGTNSLLRNSLRASWLCFVGKVSFGMYICHMLVIKLLIYADLVPTMNFWLTQLAFVSLAVGISTFIAWLSYQYLEKPFLRLKPPYELAGTAPRNAV